MGYTHYWKNKPSFSKHSVAWNNFIKDAEDILLVTESLQLVRAEFDQLDMIPEVGENRIKFNGIGEDGHETFIINREDDEDFEFCKTARKPYDKIVTAILALAKHHLVIPSISSDGTSDDWDEGVDYASKILNKNIKHPFNPQYKHKNTTGESMTLHEIPLSETTKILVTKDTINEKTFGQIRVWTKPKDKEDYIPTKKGIAFDLSKTGAIVAGLLTLEDQESGGEA